MIFVNDQSNKRIVSIRILKSLVTFGPNLEDYSHLIMPIVVRMTEYSAGSLKKISIITLGRLAKNINLSEMSSRIVQALVRILNNGDRELTKATMNTLSLLLLQLGTDFVVFVPVINKALLRNRIQHSVYDQLVNKLLNNECLPTNIIFDKENEVPERKNYEDEMQVTKLPVNQNILKNAWYCSQQKARKKIGRNG